MSNAKPMAAEQRKRNYAHITILGVSIYAPTPRQNRRAVHKKHKQLGGQPCGRCTDWDLPRKGRPTPRQQAASGPGQGQSDG